MRSEKFQAPAPKTSSSATHDRPLPTFLDHVYELRRRLFWVVAVVLVAASVSYNFLNTIINVLTYPLGDMRLFYLTPGGGLSFSFKLCAYVGILVAVPVIMFHIYRFLEPLMGSMRKSALFYVGLSSLLALSGVLFAYFVSLPGALHFLTNFNMNHIQAMLTADSYLSFVLTYLLGAALLFQIPLLLLIINTMTPLKPSKLMKLQRFVVVGAFLLGAIISPTPDIMNQTFLALPIIGMYQLGVGLVWLQNRSRARAQAKSRQQAHYQQPTTDTAQYLPHDVLEEIVRARSAPERLVSTNAQSKPQSFALPTKTRQFNDIQFRPQQPAMRAIQPVKPTRLAVQRPEPGMQKARPAQRLSVPRRSVDGFTSYRTPAGNGYNTYPRLMAPAA